MKYILIILILSQIVTFYFLFRKGPIDITKESLRLVPIPKKSIYTDVDPNHEIIYEILETIKLENWESEIIHDIIYKDSWKISMNSPNEEIKILCRIRTTNDGEVNLPFIRLRTNGANLSIDNDSPIRNDIILFFWDYIIKHEEKLNKNRITSYKKTKKSFRKHLKGIKNQKP